MSVQFGRWNFEGQPPAADYIEKVSVTLAPYGPDSNESYARAGIKIFYRAFHTTKESRRETQPHVSSSGAVITWDGRLDNRAELISELPDSLTITCTDVEIVAAAYEEWGSNCFAKLIGDWALSIWNSDNRSLLLAKDPIGTRHLYYSIDHSQVTWSTILDPLVLFAGKTFAVNEEYVAGWFFSYFPSAHLTPYAGIQAVPPSSSVLVRPQNHTVSKYWDFDPGKRICYRTDTEYEEHFRTVFATAVQRRLRSDRPVLAELSGGMDSSSIVCMADIIMARGEAEIPRLDTISWYDDSNPGLDERPYFVKVEQKRGRTGYHINLGTKKQIEKNQGGSKASCFFELESDRLAATPDCCRNSWTELFEHYAPYMRSQGYRVTLSGIAGEDPTGGFVPTPTVELQNLLARTRLFALARQLNAWATKMRKSRFVLLWEALRGFFTCSVPFPIERKDLCPPLWFQSGFIQRNRAALYGFRSKVRLCGALPSFQNQIHLLNHERRFLAHRDLWPELLLEMRYPYARRTLAQELHLGSRTIQRLIVQGWLEVRDPRITRKSLDEACKTGRLTASLHDQQLETKETAMLPSQEEPAAIPSNNSISAAPFDSSKPPRSCRAKRIWADVARQLGVDAEVIGHLVFLGVLKFYDPRVTEQSLTKFCARYGALIKTDFLDAETRDWLAGSMDLAPGAGKDEARRLEAFRKHALVVRTCEHCGRAIRGNVFFRHNKGCPQRNRGTAFGRHS